MEGCLEVKELITTVYYIESRPAQSAVGYIGLTCVFNYSYRRLNSFRVKCLLL